jgi:sigma-B regulation protein RsbU (phosphoserine phosphatase)
LTVGSKLFHQTHWFPLLQLQGSVAEVQIELVHRDSHTLPALVNAALYFPDSSRERKDGRVQVAIFIATDRRKYERELLLARRRAEELLTSEREAQKARSLAEARLRLALDSASLYTWQVELPGGAITYERQVGALLGRPDAQDVSPDEFASSLHPADREREAAAFADAIDPAQRAPYSTEYRLIGVDGVERRIHATGRGFFDDTGAAVGFTGVLEDVTARRRAEDALREREAEAAQRAVLAEQLVGIVSHDLRNPLNAVLLGTHLLRASELSASSARVAARIASSADRANRLVADLLDFTQARLGGGLRVTTRPMDLHSLVAECVEEVRIAWPGRMIDVQTYGGGTGRADPDRLAQLVGNLATNALTYGAAEQPVIVASYVNDESLELKVSNHGRPIPNELLAHIFEPLRRGEHSVKLGSRSIGLGLYIVQQIAAAHGGRVTVTSSEAEGTCFTVRLPRDDVEVASTP